jgi:lipid-A-disaccharide synthase
MRVYVLAGEISGDTHGAGLMKALQTASPDVRLTGLGGPAMQDVSSGVEQWLDQAAVVGLSEVLANIRYFRQRMAGCLAQLVAAPPDAVVLVDYPGFNLRLARALRAAGVKTRILYYISPQVWAWKKGRLKVMAELLDLMICIFPFEKPLYERSGLRTEFAGHPMTDRVKTLRKDLAREPGLVGWFPGSRYHEVRRHFPLLLQAARLIANAVPGVRFVVSAATEKLADQMRVLADESGAPEAKNWIEVGTVYDLMQRCEVGAVASGTATLEAACFGLPHVLIYRVSWPTYGIAKVLVNIPFLGIINVLAQRGVVRELVQGAFTAEAVASAMQELLGSAEKRAALQADMAGVVVTLGEGGAYEGAAQWVLKALNEPLRLD